MNLESYDLVYLERKCASLEAEIRDIKKALECVPVTSYLGTLSLNMSLIHRKKKHNAFLNEISKRKKLIEGVLGNDGEKEGTC